MTGGELQKALNDLIEKYPYCKESIVGILVNDEWAFAIGISIQDGGLEIIGNEEKP